ncbi:unnamed protein product [Penicillium glandicola]
MPDMANQIEPWLKAGGENSASDDSDEESLAHLKTSTIGGIPNQRPGYWARLVLQRPWLKAIRPYAEKGSFCISSNLYPKFENLYFSP